RAVGDVESSQQAGYAVPQVVIEYTIRVCPATPAGTGPALESDSFRPRTTPPLARASCGKACTTSTTLFMNCGSEESLKAPCRCGLRSKRLQIRPMVDFDSPVRSAIEARDRCVSWPRGTPGGFQGRHEHVLDLVEQDLGWPRPEQGSSCALRRWAMKAGPAQRRAVQW